MSYDTYTTIPALTQPKVSKSMDHGNHFGASGGSTFGTSGGSILVGALMKSINKKKMKKSKKEKKITVSGMPTMKGM